MIKKIKFYLEQKSNKKNFLKNKKKNKIILF